MAETAPHTAAPQPPSPTPTNDKVVKDQPQQPLKAPNSGAATTVPTHSIVAPRTPEQVNEHKNKETVKEIDPVEAMTEKLGENQPLTKADFGATMQTNVPLAENLGVGVDEKSTKEVQSEMSDLLERFQKLAPKLHANHQVAFDGAVEAIRAAVRTVARGPNWYPNKTNLDVAEASAGREKIAA